MPNLLSGRNPGFSLDLQLATDWLPTQLTATERADLLRWGTPHRCGVLCVKHGDPRLHNVIPQRCTRCGHAAHGAYCGVDSEDDPTAGCREAALSIYDGLNELEARVLRYLAGCDDGATDEEGIEATGLKDNTYRPRRIKLMALGRVTDSGRTRPTHCGRKAVVWVVKEAE